jgi:hypothetical protein
MNFILYWSMLIVICGFALSRGRRYERVAAGICLAGSVLTLLVHGLFGVDYVKVASSDMIIDFAVLGGFVLIALQSDRFWPLWIAGFQLTSSIAHLLKAVDDTLIPQAYAAAERFWSYPILLFLALGTWRQYRRMQREGASPAAA